MSTMVVGPDDKLWFKYGAQYECDGQAFIVQFFAHDDDHAERMLDAIRTTGVVLGRLVHSEEVDRDGQV